MKFVFRFGILALAAVSFISGFYLGKASPIPLALNPYGDFDAKVVRMRDGDTPVIEAYGEEEAIRYIGIDTPETKHPEKGEECFGKEAAEKSANFVLPK